MKQMKKLTWGGGDLFSTLLLKKYGNKYLVSMGDIYA